MFAQIALSNGSNNYLFEVRLDDKGINALIDNKKDIKKMKERINEENISIDEYNGEILGLSYTETSHENMLKELSALKKSFESIGVEVSDLRVTTLAKRLKRLSEIELINMQLIKTLYKM